MGKEEFKNCLSAVAETHRKIFEDYISGNYIDSLAKILCFVEDGRAENLLAAFAPEVQKAIIEKCSAYKKKPEETYSEALHVLNIYDTTTAEDFQNLVRECHTVSWYDAEKIIDSTCGKNIILAEKLRNRRIVFEDLVLFDDRAIQKILREVDSQDLVKALKISSEELKDKIFRNMSKRSGAMLKEDMEFMGPVRKTDVIEAQDEILEIISWLEDRGELFLPLLEDGEVVV